MPVTRPSYIATQNVQNIYCVTMSNMILPTHYSMEELVAT